MPIKELIQEIAGKRRFINLLTDWGFKTIFMKEQNKSLLRTGGLAERACSAAKSPALLHSSSS